MTICAPEGATALGSPHRPALTIAADGSYAARLARHDDAAGSRFPERWTLSGPEPYAVPLAGSQPEEPDSELLPLADGRVLILRRVADRFALSLLYPTGPGTGELLLGAVEARELTLLPPAPGGVLAYALAVGERGTALWRVHGGRRGPERVTEVPGRCTGGVWLDRDGRLLALDRELGGRTKTVVLDLERGGEASPLLQITEESNDRLLLADPDSGLLLLRSDAPGHDRLGWGVLGSSLPVRFPECLRPADGFATPFAAQPGQMLTPESCAVALRIDTADGTRLGVWRPSERRLRRFPAPEGWLKGAGLWTASGELLLPCATETMPCGVARMAVPLGAEAPGGAGAGGGVTGAEVAVVVDRVTATGVASLTDVTDIVDRGGARGIGGTGDATDAAGTAPGSKGGIVPDAGDADNRSTASAQLPDTRTEPSRRAAHPLMHRPVPLQQAPLSTQEAQWSAISRQVRIPTGATQPVDPATDSSAWGQQPRRLLGEVPTRTAVSDLTE
ncbi:hypothetical protein [Streptomyces natalensis]|uniref:Uncharacterized protein n=1 Tax=Streptomyces natalensis ATCC 27448 TaxID=1240678 RepID=A0A0D7CQU4_9ACTN|nr:hypothetical protein [Streptomyces natalensis]KIZ18598.1 hypothetical protein SNA_08360 [Streptomyces natalensis ATCC 27448]